MSGSNHVAFQSWRVADGAPSDAAAGVARTIADYALAVDAQDWALLASCFAPDASVSYQGFNDHDGREAIIEGCRRSLVRFASTHHLLGVCDATLIGDAEATSSCPVIATHARAGDDEHPATRFTIGGTYRDRLALDGDHWVIRHRTLEVEWSCGDADAMRWP